MHNECMGLADLGQSHEWHACSIHEPSGDRARYLTSVRSRVRMQHQLVTLDNENRFSATIVANLNTKDGNVIIVLVVAGPLEDCLQRLIDARLQSDLAVTCQFLHETVHAEHLAIGILLFDRAIAVEIDAIALLIGNFLQMVIGVRHDSDWETGGIDLYRLVVPYQDRWRMSGGDKLKYLLVRVQHRVATGEELGEIPIHLK